MLKHGRRGVAFGCVEVCVNSQSFNPPRGSWESVWPWLHSHLLYFYLRVLFAVRSRGVTSPRLANVSIKSSGACLKAALFTHGVLVDRRGKVIPKRINKSTWGDLFLKGRAIFFFFFFFSVHAEDCQRKYAHTQSAELK